MITIRVPLCLIPIIINHNREHKLYLCVNMLSGKVTTLKIHPPGSNFPIMIKHQVVLYYDGKESLQLSEGNDEQAVQSTILV